MAVGWFIYVIVLVFLSSLKVVYQYQRGVRFTLGRYSGIMNPGLRFIWPIIQKWEKVDMRVKVNAVLYFKVTEADRAVIKVEDYLYAVSQLAQTTMRNVVGATTLDQLLSSRDEINKKIEEIVDKASEPWGINVQSVDLKDISLPDEMQRTMAKEAETERERRAMIIISDGERLASSNLMKAAGILGKSPGAIHLRTLQNFNDISSDPSNTIVFAVPVETLGALEGSIRR